MNNIKAEPLPLMAELVDDSGQTVCRGVLTLSPTPGELEFRSSSLPTYRGGEAVGFIVYTDDGILVSFVGHVGFYGSGIIGICMIDENAIAQLTRMLSQNISEKTFAVYKPKLLSKREDFDISLTRVGIDECAFTTIENIEVGMELTIDFANRTDTANRLKLKKYRIKITEKHPLSSKVILCISTPIKLSKENRAELEFYLR